MPLGMKLKTLVYAVRFALGIPVPRHLYPAFHIMEHGQVIHYPYYTVLS